MGIVVIGPTFVDIKGFPINKYIDKGRNEGTVKTVHGGVARNIVEDIANLELRPTFLSLVDDNAYGDDVIERLKKHKVNIKYIKKEKDGMGTWLAIFNEDGDVVSSISKRPNFLPIVKTIEDYGDEIFTDCDSISIELDADKRIIKKVLEYAKKYKKHVYACITNMSIAVDRRDLFKKVDCVVCNLEEVGILFMENYDNKTPQELSKIMLEKIKNAKINSIVVTMGEQGAVYACKNGEHGEIPAFKVKVVDTTGAGDSFFAGVCTGLTYGKTLKEACEIGTKLAASVVQSVENVCPRFLPSEFKIDTNKKTIK